MKLQRITSPKHPGDIFFKVAGSKEDFICKFYAGKEAEADFYQKFMEKFGDNSEAIAWLEEQTNEPPITNA